MRKKVLLALLGACLCAAAAAQSPEVNKRHEPIPLELVAKGVMTIGSNAGLTLHANGRSIPYVHSTEEKLQARNAPAYSARDTMSLTEITGQQIIGAIESFGAPDPAAEERSRYQYGEGRLLEYCNPYGWKLRGALLLPTGYKSGQRVPLTVFAFGHATDSNNIKNFGMFTATASCNMYALETTMPSIEITA